MKPRTLMMIDDDRVILDLVGKFLKTQKWGFHRATTGAEGLALAKEARPSPDVILLDIELPDDNGWEVCRKLKADPELRATPVVMVSGKRMSSEDKALGLSIGADDYLTKPFDLSVMVLKVEAILRVTDKAAK